MTATYRHDQAIADLVHAGHTNQHIATLLGIHRNTVHNARERLGLANHKPATRHRTMPTLQAAYHDRTQPTPDGHLLWTGSATRNGTQPLLKHHGETHQAARVAWQLHHGTQPAGPVRTTCGQPLCVQPTHLTDTDTRQRHNTVLRHILALGPTPDTCYRWHGPDQQRVDSNGYAYCNACRIESKHRMKEAA